MPDQTFQRMVSEGKAIGSFNLAWNVKVVAVAFNGGTTPLYQLIEKTAMEWTSHGGELRFSFRNPDNTFRVWSASDKAPAGAIRISFNQRGNWSVVGTLADNVPPYEATMNFENYPKKLAQYFNGKNPKFWMGSYEHSTILHEFGHALGLSHEHFHPQCQADLKLKQAIAWLKNPPNSWDEDQARFNMEAAYYFKVMASNGFGKDTTPTVAPSIDRESVMLYGVFPPEIYTSNLKSPCRPTPPLGYATTLSKADIAFYLASYSKIDSPF